MKIKKFLINRIPAARSIALRSRKKGESFKDLKSFIEKNNLRLTKKIENQAWEYANDVLRGAKDYYALCFYALHHGQFKEGWIPEAYYLKYVVPKENRDLFQLTQHKTLTKRVLNLEDTPDVAHIIDGQTYDLNLNPITADIALRACKESGEYIFHKCDKSRRGLGIKKIETKNLTKENLLSLPDGCIQRQIQQHAFFDEINSTSLSTIRIVTRFEPNQEISIRGNFLRTSFNSEQWVMAKSGVRVAILNPEGELDSVGHLSDHTASTNHPDSGFIFKQQKIPNFKTAQEFCISLHKRIPHLKIIGWDVAINKKGLPELIEWNGAPGIRYIESRLGPCFRDLEWNSLHKRYKTP